MDTNHSHGEKGAAKSQCDSAGDGTSSKAKQKTDWSLCLFCQMSTKEKLVCPADSKRRDPGAGYHSLEDI